MKCWICVWHPLRWHRWLQKTDLTKCQIRVWHPSRWPRWPQKTDSMKCQIWILHPLRWHIENTSVIVFSIMDLACLFSNWSWGCDSCLASSGNHKKQIRQSAKYGFFIHQGDTGDYKKRIQWSAEYEFLTHRYDADKHVNMFGGIRWPWLWSQIYLVPSMSRYTYVLHNQEVESN